MHDPETAKVWQMAFGKDFGGMAQGNNEMGQRETNSIFVMTHTEIEKAYAQNKCTLLQKLSLISAHKKKIHITSKSQPGATSSNTKAMYPHKLWIWQH
jgi:hypothetical protein